MRNLFNNRNSTKKKIYLIIFIVGLSPILVLDIFAFVVAATDSGSDFIFLKLWRIANVANQSASPIHVSASILIEIKQS